MFHAIRYEDNIKTNITPFIAIQILLKWLLETHRETEIQSHIHTRMLISTAQYTRNFGKKLSPAKNYLLCRDKSICNMSNWSSSEAISRYKNNNLLASFTMGRGVIRKKLFSGNHVFFAHLLLDQFIYQWKNL